MGRFLHRFGVGEALEPVELFPGPERNKVVAHLEFKVGAGVGERVAAPDDRQDM